MATRIAIVVEHFDSELEKNPKTSAPKLAEILVGASAINLSYRKLYEIALDRVKQRVRGR